MQTVITIAVIVVLVSIVVLGLLSVLRDLLDRDLDESPIISEDDLDSTNMVQSATPKWRS
jgi:hypothetical protein